MIIVQKRSTTSPPASAAYTIPEGGTVMWYGTAASLPANWVIDTAMNDQYVMGAAEGGATDVSAGSLSHTHTVPNTSTVSDHTHSIGGGVSSSASSSTTFYATSNTNSSAAGHTHYISSATSGGGGSHYHTINDLSVSGVYPPYCKLYFIKSTAPDVEVPVKGIVLFNGLSSNIPTGWNICDGTNSTPNLVGKFPYGATSDGIIGANGGSITHVHTGITTNPAGYHTHSLSVDLTGGGSNNNASNYGGPTVAAPHTHGASATSLADSDHTHTVGNTSSTEIVLPPLIRLYFIMRGA